MSDELNNFRDEIRAIDLKLIELLARRLEFSHKVGEYKQKREMPVEDPHMEMRKRRERRAELNGLSGARDIERIFSAIIKVSREVQRRDALGASAPAEEGNETSPTFAGQSVERAALRLAVMGATGSFSEEAALQYIKNNKIEHHQLLYPVSAEGVFYLLDSRQADIGIFPIHNSTAGLVMESIYAASEHTFVIDDIFDLDIRHNLMVLPGVRKEAISAIMSHPQALAQCKGYLARVFPNVPQIESSDTATAAAQLSSGATLNKNTAVIAPKRCADLYNLELLESNIQDLEINFTQFIAAVV
ncbi:hypothetical protein CO046_02045 [Candidatus Peregrinibacteria bacterium CG_4_9_14_0_2_um_filter_53_11]|nr:MAG: hypothetical protein CO046_02045 [Candidatus Peregrinibacteria bacterium CG_4_9_14_0_2_um_filter_53_11]